mgnify:CR=1 FL=1
MKINLEEDGFVDVEFGGATVTLDLFDVNNRLFELEQQNKGKPQSEFNAAIVDLMAGLGLPRCSHRVAVRFHDSIAEEMLSLKKKQSPMPDSPASTRSTPSNTAGCT